MAFSETQAALMELTTEERFGMGGHTLPMVLIGNSGMNVGEEPFMLGHHDPSAINHHSVMAAATGELQVRDTLPSRPLEIAVVTDYGSRDDRSDIVRRKRDGAVVIADALRSSVPDIADTITSYVVGASKRTRLQDGEERLRGAGSGDSEESRAAAIANLAANGIVMVLSDFRHLPLHIRANQDMRDNAVAVKVNHRLERRVPFNVGVLSLSGGIEINTGDPEQVVLINKRLTAIHNSRLDKLRNAGIATTNVTLAPSRPEGYYAPYVDRRLAEGLKQLMVNQFKNNIDKISNE